LSGCATNTGQKPRKSNGSRRSRPTATARLARSALSVGLVVLVVTAQGTS
jgi:hypothetical protein